MEGFRFLPTASQCLLPLLPLFVFAGLFALFLGRSRMHEQEDRDWREAFLYSAAAWTALTFAFIELLSLRSAINSLYLALCWGFVVLALLFLLTRSQALRFPTVWSTARKLPVDQKVLLLWIILSLTTTALIAFVAPPNNWDSMSYHMSRVAHWWANNTIAFYPTNIQTQLYSSPLAEYMILQFFVLGGGSDRLANLVQWFCFGGCAVAMSLIARRLGADRFTQLLAAFIVLTTPISILEATSTQNDLACAFLTATTLYFLYCGRTVLTGLCLGLAILIKSPAGLAVAPFLLLFFFRQPFNRRGIFRAAAKLAAIGVIVSALNMPHWLRNQHTFGNPLGYETHVKWISSQTLAPGPFVTNVMRNLAVELETTSPRISKREEDAVREFCKMLRLDPDDPRNTFRGDHFSVGVMTAEEDYAANPLQTALLIAATIFLLASRRLRHSEAARFAIFVWAGFLLIAWRLSWQPWISRIHIPFLVLSSLPIAVFLNEVRRHSRFVAGTIIAVLAAMSLQPLRHNETRPLVYFRPHISVFTTPRAEQYFAARPEERSCYVKAIDILADSSCRIVGVKLSEFQWEYPLWALARSRGAPIYFEHIEVNNQTRTAKAGFQGTQCAKLTVHDDVDNMGRITAAQAAWIELHTSAPNGADIAKRIDCKP